MFLVYKMAVFLNVQKIVSLKGMCLYDVAGLNVVSEVCFPRFMEEIEIFLSSSIRCNICSSK